MRCLEWENGEGYYHHLILNIMSTNTVVAEVDEDQFAPATFDMLMRVPPAVVKANPIATVLLSMM